eukprot:TRINITY_DN82659_c0_g1_i1.p1 TRINITY_DN82659_c0_g1~~TRINITY_DN82659_c0_g1_i1.p1  ORF type:complete len:275 (-),score=16.35 TRINITY_DN82659_c0_g1_i1:7-831(-)
MQLYTPQTEYGSSDHTRRFGMGGGLPGSTWAAPLRPRSHNPAPYEGGTSWRFKDPAPGAARHGAGHNGLVHSRRPRSSAAMSTRTASSTSSTLSRVSSSRRSRGRQHRRSGGPSPLLRPPPPDLPRGQVDWELPWRTPPDVAASYRPAGVSSSGACLPLPPPGGMPFAIACPRQRSPGGAAGKSTVEQERDTALNSTCRYHGMRYTPWSAPASYMGRHGNSDGREALLGGTLRSGTFVDDLYCRGPDAAGQYGAFQHRSYDEPREGLRHIGRLT